MERHCGRLLLLGACCLIMGLTGLSPLDVRAQLPVAPNTGDAQRAALNAVRTQVNWLQNATRTAPNYGANGYGNVWQQFQGLRGAYGALRQTLTPQQAAAGANDLAELEAGLDILQEAFSNYQADLAAGRPVTSALNDLCQVLYQGSRIWLQEFNKDCSRLRVGWR